jgi:hypothetical protein
MPNVTPTSNVLWTLSSESRDQVINEGQVARLGALLAFKVLVQEKSAVTDKSEAPLADTLRNHSGMAEGRGSNDDIRSGLAFAGQARDGPGIFVNDPGLRFACTKRNTLDGKPEP